MSVFLEVIGILACVSLAGVTLAFVVATMYSRAMSDSSDGK